MSFRFCSASGFTSSSASTPGGFSSSSAPGGFSSGCTSSSASTPGGFSSSSAPGGFSSSSARGGFSVLFSRSSSSSEGLSANPRCLSCRKEHPFGKAGTCKECYEELKREIESLKRKVNWWMESHEELKRENEDLKSKVKFVSCCSPVDHLHFHNPEEDSSSSYFTDVVLVASDDDNCGHGPIPSVPAHKAILTSRSPVFKAMLRNEMEESQSSTIKISEVSYNILRAFVHYLYTAEVPQIDDQMAHDLLVLGEKYQVKHLKAYCENFLRCKLNAKNALMCFAFASQQNAKELLEASLLVITDNMDKLTMQEEYKELAGKDPHLILGIYEAYLARKDNTRSPLPQDQA